MFDNEKEAVLKVINSLWAHDAWNWGNTCAKLVNQEIDWDKPAILDIDGEYITANVYVKDGREFQIGYQEGGWFMCFIKDCNDPRARLTQRAADGGYVAQISKLRWSCGLFTPPPLTQTVGPLLARKGQRK